MNPLAIASFAAFAIPMAVMLARALPGCIAACRRSKPLAAALAAALAASALFLFSRPHDDSFAGLDCAANRDLAAAIAEGRPLVGPDTVLALAPPSLQSAFRYRTGASARPTRDLAFQLEGGRPDRTVPFFTPFLPLAAAGSGAPLFFPAMLATLWVALLLAACASKGGWAGLASAAALLLATPWPSWFLRGFYAEGAGALLATSVLASALARDMERPATFAVAGFALGFAASVHPTLVAISAPVALALLPSARGFRNASALALGMAAGLVPIWLSTRFICHPYGDWTRLETLAAIFRAAPEHRVMMGCAALACLLCAAAVALAPTRRGRAVCARIDAILGLRGWLAIALLPPALCVMASVAAAKAPALFGGGAIATLASGARATWQGIRLPCLALLLAGAYVACWNRERPAARIALAGFSFASLLFLYVKGLEVPVGIWSQRRFLPVALSLAALLAPVLAADAAKLPRGTRALTCLGMLALGLVSPVRWPSAYFGVNEEGAREWCRDLRDAMDSLGRPLTVFDYFPHSVPHAASLKYPVLGLSDRAADRWPEVAQWIRGVCSTGMVAVATSYCPATLEDGFALVQVHATGGRFKTVVGRRDGYLPVIDGERTVDQSLLLAMPLAAKNSAPPFAQHKVFDGGPIGLRGPWGATRNGGTWTRQGSGLVGPVPSPGGAVAINLDAAWFKPEPSWTVQAATVEAPWGATARFEVPEGRHEIKLRLEMPADAPAPETCVYTFSVERPYDPAAFGQRGFDSDLGIFLYDAVISVIIRGPTRTVASLPSDGELDSAGF